MTGTVLVTGTAGFIGSHLAGRLIHLGYHVVGIDNFDDYYSPEIKRANVRALAETDAFECIEGDIRDESLLARVFSEHDVVTVMHLAARAGVRPSMRQPSLYQDVNVGGTVNLLEASCRSGVSKFVFASSSSVYGLNVKAPFREAETGHPISPYAASKAAAELFCLAYNHLYSLPILALRLFTVYGPGQRPEMAVHRFVRKVQQGDEVILFGDGTAKRDYTYIDDIIDGFEMALAYGDKAYDVFNLGRGNAVDLRYLLSLIEKALNKKARMRSLALQPGEVPLTLADISKARNVLGYKPKVSVEQGIPEFVRWYLENGRS